MNIFEYVPLMKELGTPVAIAGIAILALFLIFIVLKMLGGMRRGTWRQLVRTCMTLLSAIASYIVAKIISNNIIGSLNVDNMESLIIYIEGYVPEAGNVIREFLSSFNTEIFEYIILLPATILLIPILTTVIFLALNLVLKIVRAIIIKIIGLKKANSNPQRLGGALLAAIEGIIWIVMVVLPISATLSLVDAAYGEAINAESEDNTALVETYEEYLMPFTKNPALCFVDAMGGRAMADGIATVKIGDASTNLREEVLSVARLLIVEISKFKDIDFSNLTADNKVAIDSIINSLSESPFISNLLVGALRSSSGILQSGLIPIEFGEESQAILTGLTDYLSAISAETLWEDIATIKDLYFTVSESGLIGEITNGGGDIMAILQEQRKNGDDTITKIVTILQSNPRTAPLVTRLTESLISTLAPNIDLGNGVTLTYDSLKSGMNEVLAVNRDNYSGEEEYMEALSSTLDTTLRNHGIELEGEIVDSIAEYIDTEYSHLDQLTDQEFNDVLLHYYDAYLDYLEKGELPENLGGNAQ